MKFRDAPIQRKLMQVILLTTGLVLLLTCTAFFIYELVTYRDLTRQQLSTLGKIVATNSTAALAFENKDDAAEILSALKAEKHVVAACLYDTTGHIFSKYPATLPNEAFPAKVAKEGYRFSNAYLEGFQPVAQDSKRLGTLYLKSNMEAIYSRFRLYGTLTSIFLVVSFLFAYLLSRRLQKTISAPVLQLAETAKKVSDRGDYSVRAAKRSNDEIGILTDAFNNMLTRIEAQNAEITSLNTNLEQKVKERTGELERANNVLTQQNEFIQTIIDSSVHLIAVFDKDYRYLIVNSLADTIFKKNKEELIGKRLLDVFPKLEVSQMFNDLKKAFHGEAVHDASYKSLISDRYFENFYIPLKDKNDEVDRVLVIGHDITDIMRANEKLKVVNSALENSNRDLEQFAYVASHDLQEPLRKIQIFSELAERNMANEEALHKYFQKINSSALRMTNLIKAVLNYSRLSKTGNAFEPVDLNTVVDHVKIDLELLIEEKNAAITTNKLPVICGIPLQLNQLFFNLIGNSLKFSEKPPIISITSQFIPQNALQKPQELKLTGDAIELVVADNGIGFKQEYADRIFSIFQRLHTNQNYAGTGIGLALCKKIIDNHGGTISVKSEPGKGTTFYIYLPAAASAATDKVATKSGSLQSSLDSLQ